MIATPILKFIINLLPGRQPLARARSEAQACSPFSTSLVARGENPWSTVLERRLLLLSVKKEGPMNPMISLGAHALLAAPAAGLIAVPHFWTPTIRFAVGLEIVWWTSALAFLVWLTRPSATEKSRPPKPERGAREGGADGAPRLAA